MTRQLWAAIACAALLSSDALADMGRSCQPRALAAAEKEAGERVAERLRKSLPSAPPGWAIRDDRSDIAAGSCQAEESGKAVPQPVGVTVSRSFVRNDPAPGSEAAPPPGAAQAPAEPLPDAARQARTQELEKQLAELQRKDRAAVAAYQAARRAGDSGVQTEASDASRRYRAEMGPLQKELRELRNIERQERAAATGARTQAAQSRMPEQRASRRDASVSIHTNLRQRELRGARPVAMSGVPSAFRDGRGVTHLLFGEWRQSGNFALAPIDETAPTTRVQAVSVRIDANEAMTEQLLEKLDLTAVKEVIASGPVQTQIRRQPAPPQAAPVQIALRIGTTKYESSGQAECKAEPQASIYGVPAALYLVSQRSGSSSLNLTLWQPKDGAAIMMSLRISAGGKSYLVDTVKAGPKRDTKGSGKATVQKTGAGGVIAVDAVDASGEKISGKIECTRFGEIQAEGG